MELSAIVKANCPQRVVILATRRFITGKGRLRRNMMRYYEKMGIEGMSWIELEKN